MNNWYRKKLRYHVSIYRPTLSISELNFIIRNRTGDSEAGSTNFANFGLIQEKLQDGDKGGEVVIQILLTAN